MNLDCPHCGETLSDLEPWDRAPMCCAQCGKWYQMESELLDASEGNWVFWLVKCEPPTHYKLPCGCAYYVADHTLHAACELHRR